MILFALVVIISAALITTQTSWFKEIVKARVEKVVNSNINGSLTIGKLDGNFFTNIKLESLHLVNHQNEDIVNIDNIDISYSLLDLINNKVKINNVSIDTPQFNIEQYNDSIWNFSNLFIEKEQKEDVDKEDFTPGFKFILSNFIIEEGSIIAKSDNPVIPENIEDINIEVSASFIDETLDATLYNFTFKGDKPQFYLKNISGKLKTDFLMWDVQQLKVETAYNLIESSAKQIGETAEGSLLWENGDIKEFNFILPDFNLKVTPDIELDFNIIDNTIALSLLLKNREETIKIDGKATHLKELLSSPVNNKSSINIKSITQNFTPENWITLNSFPLTLNSEISITTNGTDLKNSNLQVKGSVKESRWNNYILTKGEIDVTQLGETSKGSIKLKGDFGEANIKGELQNRVDSLSFALSLSTKDLALHNLLPENFDSTYLSSNISSNGIYHKEKSPDLTFEGGLYNSLIEKIETDSLTFNGDLKNEILSLDTLQFKNRSLLLAVKGEYSLINGDLTGEIDGDLKDGKAFNSYTNIPAKWEELLFNVSSKGNKDSLDYTLNMYAKNIYADTLLHANHININSKGIIEKEKKNLSLVLNSGNITSGAHSIDSLNAEAALNDSLWSFSTDISHPEDAQLSAKLSGNIHHIDQLLLNELNLKTSFTDIYLSGDPTEITINDSLYKVAGLQLKDRKDSLFSLHTNGVLEDGKRISLKSRINNFNLELLSGFGLYDQYMKGRTNFSIDIEGEREKFNIAGETVLKDLELEPITVSKLKANFSYPGDSVLLAASIVNMTGDSININFHTPLDIDLNDSLLISWPKTFVADAKADNTKLNGFFIEVPDFEQPDALLSFNLKGSGLIDNPDIEGFLTIDKGRLPLPQYGIDYRDIKLIASAKENRVVVDSLFTRHQNGTLLINGEIEMDSSLLSGKLKRGNAALKADRFYIMRHRDYEVQANADLFFNYSDSPVFGGNINILRSMINPDAIMDMATENKAINEPLLVQALHTQEGEEQELVKDTLKIIRERTSAEPSHFIEQLRGEIKIVIPRNTWIRSPDMQMELYGDIDVVKNSDIFELFGNVGVHRGFYTLYGKKLNIREGEITFAGGDPPNINLNLKAGYIFRSQERVRRELTFIVTGSADSPEITFELDGDNIPEADAMAYLLFGQSFDELSYGNQEGVSNAVSSRLLTGALSAQLSRTIGDTFNLDMIEIDAGDNWQNTTFMVGKYITNDLFVTYQRSFGQSGDNAITPEVLTLEYELSRRLSFRLIQGEAKDSGVDFILKFEK
ncbi:translocation/assembly module TamB domain-containing protein [Marinilabiliaceae bacterium ANBcel2]|nr:translocation/assembly module TamB domain-containing protein [Marinilabiliaceae bacterium ANBcel2]